MFKKTQKRIYATLMTITAVLIVLIITPSLIAFTGMFYNAFRTTARNRLDRSLSSCRIFIDSVMSTTDNLAYNTAILETVKGERTGSITSILDDTCTYSLSINAITVYSADGKIYTSSGVINPPTIDDLRQIQDLAEFIDDGEAADYVSLRTSQIIKVYDNAPYDENSGIVSCCRKIYDTSGEVAGYIFSDIFPETLFGYFNYADSNLKDCIAMITFSGGYFSSENSYATENYLTATANSIRGNRLIVSSTRNFYGGSVRLAVSVSPLYGSIALISCILLLCGSALMVLTHFIAKKNALRVAGKLDTLLIKMQTSTERFTEN